MLSERATHAKYINICQNSVARLIQDTTPQEYSGLYTQGIETCFVIIIVGSRGISLIHNSGKLNESDIETEFQQVAPIISWTIAYPRQSHHHLPGDFEYILNEIPQRFNRYGLPNKEKIEQGFVYVDRHGRIETKKPLAAELIFTDTLFDMRQKINTVNDFFVAPGTRIKADLQFDGVGFSDVPKLGHHDEKIALFQSMAHRSGSPMILNYIVRLHQEVKDFLEARDHERKKDLASTFKTKGNQFFQEENYPKALFCFNHAIDLNPYFKEAWLNKAKTLFKLNKFEEALDAAQEAQRIDPTWKSAATTLQHIKEQISLGSIESNRVFRP